MNGLNTTARTLTIATALALLAACTATRTVEQVQITDRIDSICVSHNPDVKNKNFENTLRDQLEARGIETRSLQGAFPGECDYEMHYNASWAWNLTMPLHVTYIHLNVKQNGQTIGSAEYNTATSVNSLEKLGTASSKLKPMLDNMFARQALLPEGG